MPSKIKRQDSRRSSAERKKSGFEEETAFQKSKKRLSVIFLGILGLGVLQFAWVVYSFFTAPYAKLSVDNIKQLKDVFFSGQPWLVLCNDGATAVHSVFREVADTVRYSRDFRTGILDCNAKLPSGKSTLEKFKMSKAAKKTSHVALVFVNGAKPHLVPSTYIGDKAVKEGLLAYTKDKVKLTYGKITNDVSFQRCVKKKNGAVVLAVNGTLSDQNKHVLASLMTRHRLLRFCTVNVRKYKIALSGSGKGDKKKKKSFLKFEFLKENPLAKGDALIVGMKRVSANAEDAAAAGKKPKNNALAYKEISVAGQPPDPNTMLTELRDTTVFDASAYKPMKLIDGEVSILMKATKRKSSARKKKQKKKDAPPEGESRKDRRARLKREHLAKQQRASQEANSKAKQPDEVDEAELQRQREAERREEMEREAAKNFAQGVDEDEQEEYEYEENEYGDDEEDDEEVIDLDDE
jgi:hypothetical protein